MIGLAVYAGARIPHGGCVGGPAWAATTVPSGYQNYSIAYGNGRYVVGNLLTAGALSSGFWSTDGITWTASSNSLSGFGYPIKVRFGNGFFFGTINAVQGATTPDGVTWTLISIPADSGQDAYEFGGGVFFWHRSPVPGIHWTADAVAFGTAAVTEQWNCGAYGAGLWVLMTPLGWQYSANLTSWTSGFLVGWFQPRSVVYANGKFVAVGQTGGTSRTVATSTDGITWTQDTSALPSVKSWFKVIYAQGQFIALAGNTAELATSPDGLTWTAAVNSFTTTLTDIAHNGTTGYAAILGAGTTVANYGIC